MRLILWSQIKLISYGFSDLHITGKVDNNQGTGRYIRLFSCVVTYCTGANRRLFMKISADARTALWEISQTPYDARPILHEFSRAVLNTVISKFAIVPPKKQVVKTRKIVTDSASDGDENHTCSILQNFNSTCSLHVNHPRRFKRNIYVCVYVFWS